jgi:hypothetical protein
VTSGEYPKRPKFFALKFVRLLTKKTVANELGPQAFTLLAVIAATEDARGYTDPVTFYNGQLYPLVGLGSEDALDRVRRKCIEAGWLHYTPGGRRLGPGRYWVDIPEQHIGTDDAPTDEPADERSLLRTGAEQTASKPRAKCGSNREQSAEPSSLSLSLSLSHSASDDAGGGKKKPGKKKPPNPNHNPAIAIFTEAWGTKYGKPYPFARGKDADAVSEILKQTGNNLDTFRRLTARYLTDPDPWLIGKGDTLALMRSRLPALVAADAPAKAHHVKRASDNQAVTNPQLAPPLFNHKPQEQPA